MGWQATGLATFEDFGPLYPAARETAPPQIVIDHCPETVPSQASLLPPVGELRRLGRAWPQKLVIL